MAKQITDQPALTSADTGDLLLTRDISAGVDKKITVAGLAPAIVSSLANNSITAATLATNAITLGHAQITSGFGTTSSTAVQVTGLSASVTIPAGGRRVKITVYCPYLTQTTTTIPIVTIWDGTVASGTQLNEFRAKPGDHQGVVAMAVVTPSAGAKTYNAGVSTTAGTITFNAAATTPAFILVETI